MWYDKLGVISIGAQSGGPDDGGLGHMKVALWQSLCRHCKSSYCPAIAHYALALRIGGEFAEFGAEGIERVRLSKRDRYIGADIVIPREAWQGRSRNVLRDCLAQQVRAALQACVGRLHTERRPVDERQFFAEVDAALAEFQQVDYDRGA